MILTSRVLVRWRDLLGILEHSTTGRVLILSLVVRLGLSMMHLDVMTLCVLLLRNLVLFTGAKVTWDYDNVMYGRRWLEFIVINFLVLIARALSMPLILIAKSRGSHSWRSIVHTVHILT